MGSMTPEVVARHARELKARYADRNTRYADNLHAYLGEYDQIAGVSQVAGGTDDRNRRYPNIQNWNLIKPTVDNTVKQLAVMPEIMVPALNKADPNFALKTDKLEKMYYALWDASQMPVKNLEMGFNLGCYGSTVAFVRPDEDLGHPVILVRKPETCYPMPDGHGGFRFVIFQWQQEFEDFNNEYPKIAAQMPKQYGSAYGNKIDIIEYVDKNSYYILATNGKETRLLKEKEHNLGMVPVAVTPAMRIPGEIFGPADIDQLVGINIYLNRLQTLFRDAVEENLYPMLVQTGENQVPINTGPGAITWLPEGHTLDRLDPPHIPSETFAAVQSTMDFFRVHASWPEVMSGQSDASIITGKAVTSLQSASTGLNNIRQNLMAMDLQKCNAWMASMMEKVWPKKEFVLYSGSPINLSTPARPVDFGVEIIPEKDINGYYYNVLQYSPFGSDLAGAIQTAMQLQQTGTTSKRWLRNLIPGIRDAEGMRAEIKEEKREDMEFEIELQEKLAEIQMKQKQQAQAAAQSAPPPEGGSAEGGTQSVPQGATPPPESGGLGSTPGMPSMLPGGQPFAMGMGEPLSGEENFPLPFENVKPYNKAIDQLTGSSQNPMDIQAPGAPVEEGIKAEEVVTALQGVQKLKGSVYLVGEIAKRGRTENSIELAITNKLDKQTIINALVQWKGKFKFIIISEGQVPPGAVPAVEKQVQEAA